MTKNKTENEFEIEFIPIKKSGGGGGIRMNADGLKKIIDSVDSILEEYKMQNNGMCPGIPLQTINSMLGLNRTNLAGLQETLNQRAFNYLRTKRLWFHSNRNSKSEPCIWLDREQNDNRYNKYENKITATGKTYTELSVLDAEGNVVQ